MQLPERAPSSSELNALLDAFHTNAGACSRAIREFARREPHRFLEYALDSLLGKKSSPGSRCLAMSVVQDRRLPDRILEMVDYPREEVVSLLDKLMQCDPSLDLKIVEALRSGRETGGLRDGTIAWAIDILDRISVDNRIIPPVQRLVKDTAPRTQSKAALFIGRRTHNLVWAARQMEDPDERVRANVVESLEGLTSPEARELMWCAAIDGGNRVAGNVLLALYRAGGTEAIPHIFGLAQRNEERFRATAAWVMGATRDPRFTSKLSAMAAESSDLVRRNAFLALQAIKTARRSTCEKPTLQISSLQARSAGDQHSLVISIRDGLGAAVKDIPATGWILSNGTHQINTYSADEFTCQKPLSVVFLLSDQEDGSGPSGRPDRRLDECIAQRHSADGWSVVRLRPAANNGWRPAAFDICDDAVLHLKHAQPSIPAVQLDVPVEFSHSGSMIQRMVAAHPPVLPVSANEATRQATNAAMAKLSWQRGAKHLICIGPFGQEGLLESDGASRTMPGIAVHVIAAPDAPRAEELRRLAERTGGFYLTATTPDEVREICGLIYSALRHHYLLHWNEATERLDIRLYAAAGYAALQQVPCRSANGATDWPRSPMPLRPAHDRIGTASPSGGARADAP